MTDEPKMSSEEIEDLRQGREFRERHPVLTAICNVITCQRRLEKLRAIDAPEIMQVDTAELLEQRLLTLSKVSPPFEYTALIDAMIVQISEEIEAGKD